MTLGDIKRVEALLEVTLPQCYIELLLRYPTALDEHGFHFGDGFEPLSKRFFVKDIDRLIELNAAVRAGGPKSAGAPAWPGHLVVVGENLGEDYYLLDTASCRGTVLIFNSKSGMLETWANSLEAYIERIRHLADEFNFWHSPQSPLLDASDDERRRLVSEHVAKNPKREPQNP